MKTIKLKLTRLQSEIFNFLCENVGNETNQSFIAKKLNVSSTAIAKALKDLEKEKLVLIKKDKLMNLNIIQLNRENFRTMQLKRVNNLKSFYESELLEKLEDSFPGATIILFGSYSKGEDTIKSDIDLAIISKKEKNLELSKFEEILKRKIIINFYSSPKEIHKELKESLCNGIVLSGGIEL
ncbi:MAG TPA: nucleotidyltransferase domain-containing protein [Candidatus Nanoarchaeia archaeon]|nr:nucleotidyltransferase domain-containing protein [Candidatus Nanoarchaeia archaeon]